MSVEKYDIADPIRTKAILERYHLQAKKSLGQNFLRSPEVIEEIVASAEIQPTDIVLEVGPGIGALTQQLAKVASQVYAFEIDQNLIPILEANLEDYDNLTLLNQDILKVDWRKFWQEQQLSGRTVKVVANLPYYITTPILLQLLTAPVKFTSFVLMMQKEVAQRLGAQPGHREYGSLSVAVQLRSQVEVVQTVPAQAFVPQPKVDSAVVRLRLESPWIKEISDFLQFQTFVQAVFRQKRKNLWNNLNVYLAGQAQVKPKLQAVFDALGYEHNVRAEQLALPELIALNQQIQTEFNL
ncbi:16S rRNA (adenine(1518)-N(6)/adenine(1519)-N(6))-dimethyltransferase RsmA [Lactobacillus sp. DCY120]|uniref:Ribosomal RNA small subunit methyltransferase A n=1 Tax=Bombilactobacillus apium TaxID=2675299 RepID=A0A850R684_9LACO|nr:16S rRNA (adenine(1518)-N(6)/adenine(1519)-N(6))-dimethyltransferase RsmA [Bombilactobacillus apium]NVY96347.1 16S rRNA (adenine(1518)-N(6)/adenine(1519)-N(6))-dimethyltransferase RsmA [Bombilactobacillus apium]